MKYIFIVIATLIVIVASRPAEDTQEVSLSGNDTKVEEKSLSGEEISGNIPSEEESNAKPSQEEPTEENTEEQTETPVTVEPSKDGSESQPDSESEPEQPYEITSTESNEESTIENATDPEDTFIIFTINPLRGFELFVNDLDRFIINFLRPFTQFRI